MKLYNTLTRTVDEIQPINAGEVTVYTCGPTVYDYPHIGNWFTFIRYDLLARTLQASGLKPKWVMNITDVGHLASDADEGEDKLEKGAKREGKTAQDIAEFYADYFEKALGRLNITTPQFLPRATQHIEEQIELIKVLETKGFTYIIDDGVYYDTSKFEGYAAFARLDLDNQQAGARVEFNSQKRNATDFALWKLSPKSAQRDMEWDSPWGIGFPGWHLECSAMGMKYLGETIDIHAGGIDHIPVHHTNEIAQSEAATGKRFANYWMHTNHILIDGDKISKSLGNGITLEDIEARGFSLQDFRMLVLQSHYRTQSKFSWDALRDAKQALRNIQNDMSWIYQSGLLHEEPLDGLRQSLQKGKVEILEALQDDLNTPKALAILHEFANGFQDVPASQLDIPTVQDFADFIESLLGVQILDKNYKLSEDLTQLLAARQNARDTKDWAESDKIRDQLAVQGIGVRDTPHGPIWYRLS